MPGEPQRLRRQDPPSGGRRGAAPAALLTAELRADQRGAVVPVIAEGVGRVERPTFGGVGAHVPGEPFKLLLNGLALGLVAGREAVVCSDVEPFSAS